VVVIANTIIDVRAVVVKSFNAEITYVTVSRSRSSDHFTFRTHVKWRKFVENFL